MHIINGVVFDTTKKMLSGRYSIARAKHTKANDPLRHLTISTHRLEESIFSVRRSPATKRYMLERVRLKTLRKKAISKADIDSY